MPVSTALCPVSGMRSRLAHRQKAAVEMDVFASHELRVNELPLAKLRGIVFCSGPSFRA